MIELLLALTLTWTIATTGLVVFWIGCFKPRRTIDLLDYCIQEEQDDHNARS